jgi:xylulokinase
MTGVADRFVPQADVQARYDRLYREVYQALFPTVQPLVDRLTELAGVQG